MCIQSTRERRHRVLSYVSGLCLTCIVCHAEGHAHTNVLGQGYLLSCLLLHYTWCTGNCCPTFSSGNVLSSHVVWPDERSDVMAATGLLIVPPFMNTPGCYLQILFRLVACVLSVFKDFDHTRTVNLYGR